MASFCEFSVSFSCLPLTAAHQELIASSSVWLLKSNGNHLKVVECSCILNAFLVSRCPLLGTERVRGILIFVRAHLFHCPCIPIWGIQSP
jgi:hypothetical protein